MGAGKRPTAWGQICRTADGTICEVRSIYRDDETQMADLRAMEDGAEITLPVAELTRIADPRNKLPPIEGMPADRPCCQRCGKKFAALTNDTYSGPKDGPLAPRKTARRFVRWSSYRGLFCTLTCALAFAELAHNAGYRITRRPNTPATKGSTT